jgi:acetylornithine deacetylase
VTELDPERIAQWTLGLCAIDSTTGLEGHLLPLLVERFRGMGARVRLQPVEGGRSNVLALWGKPRILFSTHLDTVPPFIAPRREGDRLWGRGACDAKGILAAMVEAIRVLLAEGERDIAFLGVIGEETDSLGARVALELKPELAGLEAVINGEPTDNRLAQGQKGSLHLRLRCRGKAAHSGTPEEGVNAAFPLLDWIAAIRRLALPEDPRLGPELWNLGTLRAGRAINIVPDEGEASLFARTVPGTTFLEDVEALRPENGEVEVIFRRAPEYFPVIPGFPAAPVPFGSDAHTLRHLVPDGFIAMTGPGSIRVAHTEEEHLDLAEALAGAVQYRDLARVLLARPLASEYAI